MVLIIKVIPEKNKMRRILNDDCDFRFSVYRELKRVMKER